MKVHAIHKHAMIAPQKARKVIGMIRSKTIDEAEAILLSLPHKAARLILKVMLSAKANAVNNFEMNPDTLYVHEAVIDMGKPWRKMLPRGMGRADIIKRRTSHIKVVVDSVEEA